MPLPRPVLLGHGASGSAASMLPWIGGLADRGVSAESVPRAGRLPNRAERAIEVFREQVGDRPRPVVGGVSYGGRVASMFAADDQGCAGVVLLSYPLHPPGKTEQQRVEHLVRLNCPVLFLSGESDPFARMDLLRAAVAAMPRARMATFPRVGHGLARNPAVLAACLDQVAKFLAELE